MKKVIIAVIFCIPWELHGQVALPTFQAVQYSELYSFSSHTFTNCGATGKDGPTLANCKSSYNTSWEDNTNFFNVQTQGIQEWTVPSNGTYTIQAWGSQGGAGGGLSTDGASGSNGGSGGKSFLNGGQGGSGKSSAAGDGGFGSGGGAGYCCSYTGGSGGGGGGYSGGGGSCGSSNWGSGGGGGSYSSSSTNTSNSSGVREGHGQVIITRS